MNISFRDVEINISGTRVLADSASLDQSASPTPAYALGFNEPVSTFPTAGLKNNIQISYLLNYKDS